MVKPLSAVGKHCGLHAETEFTQVMQLCTLILCGLPQPFFYGLQIVWDSLRYLPVTHQAPLEEEYTVNLTNTTLNCSIYMEDSGNIQDLACVRLTHVAISC